jgi:hypothetical protein
MSGESSSEDDVWEDARDAPEERSISAAPGCYPTVNVDTMLPADKIPSTPDMTSGADPEKDSVNGKKAAPQRPPPPDPSVLKKSLKVCSNHQ